MTMRQVIFIFSAATMFASSLYAQQSALRAPSELNAPSSQEVELAVPNGTPITIALEKEIRVRKVGEPVTGRVVRPVYVFDHLVIPAGTEVAGQITKIGSIPAKRRLLALMNGNLTPSRTVDVEFKELRLGRGEQKDLHAVAASGSAQILRFTANDKSHHKKTAKDVAAAHIQQARQQARQEWQNAISQIKEPGKVHRLMRFAIAQLPVHPQYLNAGAMYFSELREPLDFGSELLAPEKLADMGTSPAPGSIVHAVLLTPLDSAHTPKGAEVEAVLSQPLLDGNRLILPQGSRLKGLVTQVQAARSFKHNGELRVSFRELILPDGLEQRVNTILAGVQANKNDHVELDEEGGARATSPKTRYLSTALSLGLAAAAFHQDTDSDTSGLGTSGAGDSGNSVAGGAGGFKLIGIAMAAAIHSQPFGMAMGAYGAGRSIYANFLGRGRDVVFPKNMAMEIEFGTPRSALTPPNPEQNNRQDEKDK
jgi:hypothetical protein